MESKRGTHDTEQTVERGRERRGNCREDVISCKIKSTVNATTVEAECQGDAGALHFKKAGFHISEKSQMIRDFFPSVPDFPD